MRWEPTCTIRLFFCEPRPSPSRQPGCATWASRNKHLFRRCRHRPPLACASDPVRSDDAVDILAIEHFRIMTTRGQVVLPVISLARVCRSSYKSAAPGALHPGNRNRRAKRPEPCILIPTTPNRTRSLGATARRSGCALSSTVLDTSRRLAAAAALPCKNARCERNTFHASPPSGFTVWSRVFLTSLRV